MRTAAVLVVLTAATLGAALAPSLAQNTGGDQEKGSTGWSGGSKDQSQQSAGAPGDPTSPATGKRVEIHDDAQAANQPALASGEDLKGPSVQLPPSKTPE